MEDEFEGASHAEHGGDASDDGKTIEIGTVTIEPNAVPMPLQMFGKLIAGTPDAIWLGVLYSFHGGEKHTAREWTALIAEAGKIAVVHT